MQSEAKAKALLVRMSLALDDLSPDETIGFSNGVQWIEVASVEEIRSAALSDKQAGEVSCIACEGRPSAGNNPCAVCGRSALVDVPAVEVKALEWVGDGDCYAFADVTHQSYSIAFEEGKYWANWNVALPPFDTLDAAKAAAQTDYEQRIRSALVDVPAVEPVFSRPEPKVFCAMLTTGVCEKDAEIKRLRDDLDKLHPPLREGEDSADVEPTHRHKKRGSEYVLIGIGKMQAEDWSMQTLGQDDDGRNAWVHESVDMREVAIYRSVDDGSLWVRPREEFEDGRFELIDAINAKGGE